MSDMIERLNGPIMRAAQDLIDAYFGNKSKVLASIPADPKRDADLVLTAGIKEAADRIAALEAEVTNFAEVNHMQAKCIHLTAQALGPDYAATIDALPKAAAHVAAKAERAEAERDALRARTVTPLEWERDTDGALDCEWIDNFGLYEITIEAVLFIGHSTMGIECETIEAAKAAAQADYAARIAAALTTADPQPCEQDLPQSDTQPDLSIVSAQQADPQPVAQAEDAAYHPNNLTLVSYPPDDVKSVANFAATKGILIHIEGIPFGALLRPETR